eukprot:8305348-Karenia_brevis.AAC.1
MVDGITDPVKQFAELAVWGHTKLGNEKEDELAPTCDPVEADAAVLDGGDDATVSAVDEFAHISEKLHNHLHRDYRMETMNWLGTDGERAMSGHKTGLAGRLKASNPHM